jgi:hypothetical protein
MTKENFFDNFVASFSIRTIIIKFVIGFIVILGFNLEGLRINGDAVFKNGGSFFSFDMLFAIWNSYSEAVVKAISSLYPVFADMFGKMEYINTSSYFSIGFAISIFILLIIQYHSIVGIIISFFVPKWSEISILVTSILVSGTIILILSVLVSAYMGITSTTLFSTALNQTLDTTLTNITNNTPTTTINLN